MNAPRYTRKNAPRELLLYSSWDAVDASALKANQQQRFLRLSEAIRLYIDGEPMSVCLDGRRLGRSQLLRAFRRCIATDKTGRQVGWRGLLAHERIAESRRIKPLIPSGRNGRGGFAGALNELFARRPDIHENFDEYLLRTAKREPGFEARIRHKSAHQKFVELCCEAGLESIKAWPFNTAKLGRGAIHVYVEGFLDRQFDQIVETQWGSKAKAKSNTGRGISSRLTAPRPLDVIELDEHRCHFIGAIGFPSPGGILWEPGERVTIIAATDRAGGALLAYKAIFKRDADADDVLDVIALVCGMPRDRMFDAGMVPLQKASFPADLEGPFLRCGFNQLLVDNALVHLTESVRTRIQDVVGCDINYGPVRRFERRARVEALFGELERHGFHRLPTTTGTDPSDPRRQAPEKAARELKLSVPQTLQIIEDVAADRNGVVTKSALGHSRLGWFKALMDDVDGWGMLFPELPPLPVGIPELHITPVPMTIRGGRDAGRRPYVYLDEAEYSGTSLCRRWELLGQDAIAHVERWNLREFKLFTKNGVFLDTVTVRGAWARAPLHSRDLRRKVNKAVRDGQLRVPYGEDPVHHFMEGIRVALEDSKQTRRGVKKALSIVADEQKNRGRKAARIVADELDAVRQTQAKPVPSASELFTMDDLCATPRGGR